MELTDDQIDSILSMLYGQKQVGMSPYNIAPFFVNANINEFATLIQHKFVHELRLAELKDGHLYLNERGKKIYLEFGSYKEFIQNRDYSEKLQKRMVRLTLILAIGTSVSAWYYLHELWVYYFVVHH